MSAEEDSPEVDSRCRRRALRRGATTQPIIFDLTSVGARASLEALTLAGAVLTVHDRIAQRDACGRWVLFPWSGRLVHVAIPEENDAPRASDRQAAEPRVVVVGLTMGSWAAVGLLRERIARSFCLADGALVRPSDIRLMPVGIHDIGTPRVEAVARAMYEIDPFVEIECFEEPVDPEALDDVLSDRTAADLVLLGSGISDLALATSRRARTLGVPVVHIGDHVDLDVLRHILARSPH